MIRVAIKGLVSEALACRMSCRHFFHCCQHTAKPSQELTTRETKNASNDSGGH